MNIDKWRKETKKIINKGDIEIEKIPALVKRCPRCGSMALEFDTDRKKIKCTKCGFEENLMILR